MKEVAAQIPRIEVGAHRSPVILIRANAPVEYESKLLMADGSLLSLVQTASLEVNMSPCSRYAGYGPEGFYSQIICE